ncbi:nucleotide sugar dehydrogenase [Paenibacillus polysaccharolyticus]|uniref:nucleotide sugar dehydrogenase n=1 Tax=Paenibacillus polysaccharolyticus TaxID=582692 RepID=UPI002042231A|nr:nucleotide sugar dehydrogenase [Paenibacillus polysaccharolyticus]MCM3131201.1 nucleotide sugar dehydrogenase [Paenibacillus polysaccharolyticus]
MSENSLNPEEKRQDEKEKQAQTPGERRGRKQQRLKQLYPKPQQTTLQCIHDRSLKAVVIGLGYVGLPMAVEMAQSGYQVHGIDIDAGKVAKLRAGHSYIIGIEDEVLQTLLEANLLTAGTDYAAVAGADVIVICVPTPLTDKHQPDISYISSAVGGMTPYLQQGSLVILESTTYPGTTEEHVKQPIEAARGWTAGEHFYVCYSPERVDPGSVHYGVKNTPKIIGGSTPACLSYGTQFYGSFLNEVVPVSSTTVAETAKLFENTFRSVNIALVNELTPACEQMGVDIWEVLQAAATKPFGYMPFYPGPGIGGHCIPIDPIYLSWAANRQGSELRFIELADATNRQMPEHVVQRAAALLEQRGHSIRGARVVLAGMAYKKDIDDLRESPALDVFRLLSAAGADVVFTDPMVPLFRQDDGSMLQSRPASPELWTWADLVIITTDHSAFDYQEMADHAPLIFDTRNATAGCRGNNIVVLGQPERHDHGRAHSLEHDKGAEGDTGTQLEHLKHAGHEKHVEYEEVVEDAEHGETEHVAHEEQGMEKEDFQDTEHEASGLEGHSNSGQVTREGNSAGEDVKGQNGRYPSPKREGVPSGEGAANENGESHGSQDEAWADQDMKNVHGKTGDGYGES